MYPIKKFEDAKTAVFWDLEDYPINPNKSHDPNWIYQNIKSDLADNDYNGDVTIEAYVDKNKLSDELIDTYLNAGIIIRFLPQGDKVDRYYGMIVHILVWALENRRHSNIIVLSKNIDHVGSVDFESLYWRGYGVLVSNPEPDWFLPLESSTLLFPNLFSSS